MRFFVLISLVAAHVHCDIGLGYQYKVPTSYEVPFRSVGNLNNGREYYHVNNHAFESQNLVQTTPSTILRTPIHEHTSFVGNQDFSLNGISPSVTSTADAGSINVSPHQTTSTQDVSSFNYVGGSLQNRVSNSESVAIDSKSSFDSQHSQEAEVNKHFYFFAAPDEPEGVRPRANIPVLPPKKDVKILFIKAPFYQAPAPIQIPVQSQNEEKTLVYVLVKKPDEQEEIIIPTPVPTQPSKPEVYFIKYKTEKEAQDAISSVRKDGAAGSDFSFANRIGSVDSSGFEKQLTPSIGLRGSSEGGIASVSSGESHSDSSSSSEISSSQHLLANNDDGISGSTTVSSISVPSTASVNLGEVGVHKLYGPPDFHANSK